MPTKVWWKFNQHHCEKTSFAVAFALSLLITGIVFATVYKVTIFQNYLVYGIGISAIAGEIGILWYRIEGKKSKWPALLLLGVTIIIFVFTPMLEPDLSIACVSASCDVPLESIFDQLKN